LPRSGAATLYRRHLHLLDNDFFGQPCEQWQARIEETRSGGFKVCLNQGINVRLLDDEAAGRYGPLHGLEYPCIAEGLPKISMLAFFAWCSRMPRFAASRKRRQPIIGF